MATYTIFLENYADFLDGTTKLVESDAALVLNIEELEGLLQESRLFLGGRSLHLQLLSQVLLESDANKLRISQKMERVSYALSVFLDC